jgi:hypothetical protein
MPSAEVIELSSSCDLSVFSPKADAQCAEGDGNTPERSSSVSIEALWAEMDMLDETNHRGSSAMNIPWNAHRERRSLLSVEKNGECASHTDKGALLNDIPGPSNAQPRGRGRGFTKNKAAQIWSAASWLFCHACGGHLLIDSIRLRPVWIKVNGRLF